MHRKIEMMLSHNFKGILEDISKLHIEILRPFLDQLVFSSVYAYGSKKVEEKSSRKLLADNEIINSIYSKSFGHL